MATRRRRVQSPGLGRKVEYEARGDHAQIHLRSAAEEVGSGRLSLENDACAMAPLGKKTEKTARVRRAQWMREKWWISLFRQFLLTRPGSGG